MAAKRVRCSGSQQRFLILAVLLIGQARMKTVLTVGVSNKELMVILISCFGGIVWEKNLIGMGLRENGTEMLEIAI